MVVAVIVGLAYLVSVSEQRVGNICMKTVVSEKSVVSRVLSREVSTHHTPSESETRASEGGRGSQ